MDVDAVLAENEVVFFMQQLNVKLRRNQQEQNWSVEINGRSHDFISIEEVDELVKRALINAQESLTDATSRSTQ